MTSVFAHRGATARCRENTIEAFSEARRLGADGVELDVRLSADEALVVHHDPLIAELGAVDQIRVSELPAHVPLLAEALVACEGMEVNVEIKNLSGQPGYDPDEGIAALVAAAIDEAGWVDRVIVSSFSAATLDAVRAADPRLALGWLLGVSSDAPARLEESLQRGYQAIHPFVTQVDRALVTRAHGTGLAVNVWTVNAPEDLAAMVELGVDMVITDRLVEALAVARP